MSSFLYPDSATRKMFGQAGRRAAWREKQRVVSNNSVTTATTDSWLKRLWLSILKLLS